MQVRRLRLRDVCPVAESPQLVSGGAEIQTQTGLQVPAPPTNPHGHVTGAIHQKCVSFAQPPVRSLPGERAQATPGQAPWGAHAARPPCMLESASVFPTVLFATMSPNPRVQRKPSLAGRGHSPGVPPQRTMAGLATRDPTCPSCQRLGLYIGDRSQEEKSKKDWLSICTWP